MSGSFKFTESGDIPPSPTKPRGALSGGAEEVNVWLRGRGRLRAGPESRCRDQGAQDAWAVHQVVSTPSDGGTRTCSIARSGSAVRQSGQTLCLFLDCLAASAAVIISGVYPLFPHPPCQERCPDPERIARGTAQRLIHENGRGTGVFGPYLALFKGISGRPSGALGPVFSAPPVHPTLAQSHYGRQLVVCLRS